MAKKITRSVERWTFILPEDTKLPVDQQTRFICKPLDGAERASVNDTGNWMTISPSGERTVLQRGFQQSRELVITHVQEIHNFPVGAAREWPTDRAAREAYLEMLDDLDVFLVGNEIREHSALGEPEGNSSRD